MTAIHVRARAEGSANQPQDVVWRAVDTVPAMTSLIVIVERCEKIEGGWRWDLGQRGAMGLNVRVLFEVATVHREPDEIAFEPMGDATRWASGLGRIRLRESGASTDVEVTLDLDLDLPLPRLLASPVARVIEREVQSTVEDFVRRWTAQVGG